MPSLSDTRIVDYSGSLGNYNHNENIADGISSREPRRLKDAMKTAGNTLTEDDLRALLSTEIGGRNIIRCAIAPVGEGKFRYMATVYIYGFGGRIIND